MPLAGFLDESSHVRILFMSGPAVLPGSFATRTLFKLNVISGCIGHLLLRRVRVWSILIILSDFIVCALVSVGEPIKACCQSHQLRLTATCRGHLLEGEASKLVRKGSISENAFV
jgi:hypothetical protein